MKNMPNEDIFPRIQACMCEALQVPLLAISRDSKQEDLEQWDSLGHLSLVLAIEFEFDVSFQMDDIPDMISVAIISQRILEAASG